MTRDAQRFLYYAAIGLAALLLIVTTLVTALGGGTGVGENKTYEISGDIRSIEVEIGAADFCIIKGDKFSVESNLKNLTFKQNGDKLILEENSFGNKNYKGAELVIFVPEGTVFTDLDITTGAGKFVAESLSAERINLEFGAGEVNIGELNAGVEADIEGGAGKITIGGGSLCNLSFEMGVGELNLTAEIIGEGDIDLGVGEVNITLVGSIENYTVELNKGVGDLRFDGESISEGRTVGTGETHVEINGGIGSVEISFE